MKRTGRIMFDFDGHNYLVPVEDTEDFVTYRDNIDLADLDHLDEAETAFTDRFGHCRLTEGIGAYIITLEDG